MAQVTNLVEYRKARKRQFLEKNKVFLDDYIRAYVFTHCQLSYEVFQHHYLNAMQQQNELAWDYLDFRETLSEVVSSYIGQTLWADIQKQNWFPKGLLSREEIIDRTISLYIIGAQVSGLDF